MRCKTLFSLALFGVAFAYSAGAHADDWGCKVLLCLSDLPAGGSACVPPVEKLWRHLARGGSMPSCTFEGGGEGHARRVYDPFDPCPDGTRAASGFVAAAATPQLARESDGRLTTEYETVRGPRACVAGYTGYRRASDGDGYEYRIELYERVEWQMPQPPRAIDVFIDDRLHQRVRY